MTPMPDSLTPERIKNLRDAALFNLQADGTIDRAGIALIINKFADLALAALVDAGALTFDRFRSANVARCIKWHPAGVESWSPSDWLTAVTGELGELASLLKMRNRERDGLVGNKFSPTDKQVADEIADVLTYLDLLAHVLKVDLGKAAAEKFNEISERNGFPDRIEAAPPSPPAAQEGVLVPIAKSMTRKTRLNRKCIVSTKP